MRPRKGCEPCRERHIKCVRDDTVDGCRQCLDNDRTCYQISRHHFRPVTSIKIKTSDDRSVRQDLVHTSSQRWVKLPPKIRFAEAYTVDSIVDTDGFPEDVQSIPTIESSNNVTDVAEDRPVVTSSSSVVTAGRQSPVLLANTHGSLPHASQTEFLETHEIDITDRSSYGLQHQTHTSNIFSPSQLLDSPSVRSFRLSWPFESAYEAQLFVHYIKTIAPWLDTCDPLSHFERDIPRRIPYHPILANSILALASRRLCLISGIEDTHSPHYAGKCIKILMETLNDPQAHLDENLLAAVVLLRLHEELLHDDDLCCHLFGARKILDSISAFAADGGLREAAAWVSLRQHVYVSFTQQRPLGMTLDNFSQSSVFDDSNNTNEAWANRMIFIFANILDVAFTSNNAGSAHEVWQNLRRQVENWYESKPWDFTPMWQDMNPANVSSPASVSTTTPRDGMPNPSILKPWPEIVMCHGSQVTGMQYYHMARAVLAVYDPELARVGFATHRLKKSSEQIVVDAIRNIVGLANSNPHCYNSMFEASHILVTCWSYLREEAEQNAAIDFLKKVQQKTGWTTSKMIAEIEASRMDY